MNEETFHELLLSLGIGNKDFFSFINGKVHRYPVEEFPWACFPILDDNEIIKDVRIIVPEFLNEKCILVNIHEYYHAYELFNELGCVYVENIDIREENARDKERLYLKKKSNVG